MTTTDNAGAAREVAELNDPAEGALAPPLAAELYGLDVLKSDIADAAHNTTRFLVFAPEPDDADQSAGLSRVYSMWIEAADAFVLPRSRYESLRA